jgi:4-hydroxybenzoate polyprenyltransferase
MQRWWVFIKERFDPLSHAAMIGCFLLVHLTLAGVHLALWQILLLALGTTAFFFKLRLYDELKDYELDCQINPSRPLARGVLSRETVRLAIMIAILVELGAFGAFGWPGFCAIVFTIGYSLLMYNEFFISERIRPLLTTYAMSHTIVSSLISLALFSATTTTLPWQLPHELLRFSLACWFIFNIFEFGRKTFASAEERPQVDSYSQVWGRSGAVLLVMAMAAAAAFCLLGIDRIQGMMITLGLALVSGAIFLAGLIYILANTVGSAKLYRGVALSYIVLIQMLVACAHHLLPS